MPDLIDAAYSAAVGELEWERFGQALRQALGAGSGALWLANGQEVAEILVSSTLPEDVDAAYVAYYGTVDPWAQAGLHNARRRGAGDPPLAFLGEEIVPQQHYLESEFYRDFARHHGIEHLVASILHCGEAGIFALGCHRSAGSGQFGEAERETLQRLLPHLRRSLQLRHRLREGRSAELAAAFELMPTAALVLDADLRVRHLNQAAQKLALAGAFHLRRHGAVTLLQAADRPMQPVLARQVREVAVFGQAGGALRLRSEAGQVVALLVMPLPAMLPEAGAGAAPRAGTVLGGRALVLARQPGIAQLPSPAVLMKLFGFSPAEAVIVIRLSEGFSPTEVARLRGTSISTVRAQLRTAMEKMGAQSLRDMTRLVSTLAELEGGAPGGT